MHIKHPNLKMLKIIKELKASFTWRMTSTIAHSLPTQLPYLELLYLHKEKLDQWSKHNIMITNKVRLPLIIYKSHARKEGHMNREKRVAHQRKRVENELTLKKKLIGGLWSTFLKDQFVRCLVFKRMKVELTLLERR